MGPSKTPSVAGELIAALEQGGELVDGGKFSIDPGQALIKLREHQLVDPHTWVLLAIEAAVLAGASPVVVPARGEIAVELGPLELRADELEQLFAWVFVDLESFEGEERLRRRALQQLAIASNAALRLDPSELVIESIDPRGQGWRLGMTPARPLGVLEAVTGASRGTRVRATGLSGERERQLIRERCRYSKHDIRIGDERISRGPAGAIIDAELEGTELGFPLNARTKPLIDAEGRTIGRFGKAYRIGATPSLLLVCNGVLIERIELDANDDLESNFVAVVEIDLPRDLSQAKVRRGPEFESIVQAARHAPKASVRSSMARVTEFRLAIHDNRALRLVGAVVAFFGWLVAFFAFALWAAGIPGASFPWFLGSALIGTAGFVLARRRRNQ